MTEDIQRPPGKTTVAPEVLLTIARLTTLQVEGVHQMSAVPAGVKGFLRREVAEGVHLQVQDDVVYLDIYVVLDHDVNVRETGRRIQQEVARAIRETVGMPVGAVNVHVQDIAYPAEG